MSRRIIGPFNRVEGDLEVKVEIDQGEVHEAWVTSPMYRGFEQILHGKDPLDALVYVPRICGICSVSQSVAAANALQQAAGVERPENGQLATNLIHACENLADHFTHFYLFFMPDFARPVYQQRDWYQAVRDRFQAVSGSAAQDALKARAEFMQLMGLLAGKWPHTLGIQPGGSTRPIEAKEKMRLLAIIQGFRSYIERELFGASLEEILELTSARQLRDWLQSGAPGRSDLALFLTLAGELSLDQLGRSDSQLMSYGVYPGEQGKLFRQGTWYKGKPGQLQTENISEDISHSWLTGQGQPEHPFRGVTLPDADSEQGYSWCKAPRLDGQVMEVGALARQVIDQQPLMVSLAEESGTNVQNRVVARMVETARVLLAMESWCLQLQPKESFCSTKPLPQDAEAFGLTEAARGSLGHWLRIKNGRLLNYQIIAPTTWNFSPRDSEGVMGPLERALVGAPVRDGEKEPVAVQHIVRSFDPCMVCTVH